MSMPTAQALTHCHLLCCSRQCRMNPPLESFINERESLFMIRPTSIARGQYRAAAKPYPIPTLGDWRPEEYTLRSRDDGPSSLQLSRQEQHPSNGCGWRPRLPCITKTLLRCAGIAKALPPVEPYEALSLVLLRPSLCCANAHSCLQRAALGIAEIRNLI